MLVGVLCNEREEIIVSVLLPPSRKDWVLVDPMAQGSLLPAQGAQVAFGQSAIEETLLWPLSSCQK